MSGGKSDVARFAMVLESIEAQAWQDCWAAATPAVREALGLRTLVHDRAFAMAADGLDSLLMNRVIGLGLAAPVSAAALDAFEAFYAGRQSFAYNVSPFATPVTTPELLTERGLATFFHHVKWARQAERVAERASTLRVQRVDGARAAEWSLLASETFAGGSEHAREWLAALIGRPGWQLFVTLDGDQVVGGAALFVRGQCAWLGMGATRESHRGRGSQSLLLAARINAALEAGAVWLTTETAPNWPELDPVSFRNVQRAGFAPLYERASWIRPPRAS